MGVQEQKGRFERIASRSPQLAGAIEVIRQARKGDSTAQEILSQFGGENNLIRLASGLPVKALIKERLPSGEP